VAVAVVVAVVVTVAKALAVVVAVSEARAGAWVCVQLYCKYVIMYSKKSNVSTVKSCTAMY
jgi:hypothetical protein